MILKRLKNPRTDKLIKDYFAIQKGVILGMVSLKWWERLIFWKKGIKWVKKRAFQRWSKRI